MGLGGGVSLSSWLIGALVVAVAFLLATPRKFNRIPSHLLGHEAVVIPGLVDDELADALLDRIKKLKRIMNNVHETSEKSGYLYKHVKVDHVGEARPLDVESCTHPFLIPNINRTHCVLPGRIDVGKHYITYGGIAGLKNSYDKMVSRVYSFGKYMFKNHDMTTIPEMKQLFESRRFTEVGARICPPDRQVLDPFQFNFIIQIPGQQVPLHLDAVYFWGASRFYMPQWLLAVMQFSGLFADKMVPQIQTVAYLHRWSPEGREGTFSWYNGTGRPSTTFPVRGTGVCIDGSQMVHASSPYMPHADIPIMDKSLLNTLDYIGDDKWELRTPDEVLRIYSTDDLRISIVYRARCFDNEDTKVRFNDQLHDPTKQMSIDSIFKTLESDLIAKNVIRDGHGSSSLDFAMLLMDNYVRYPTSHTSLVVINYCALPRLLDWGWLTYAFSTFC